MLSSCLNLAGCNSISYEAGKQSRQVLRLYDFIIII